MKTRNGFTLIEALITTVILVLGLSAVAGTFSYSALTAMRVSRETTALALVTDKMESLKLADELVPGLHSEYLVVRTNGDFAESNPQAATYLRTFEVTSHTPARVTVIVYGREAGRVGSFRELSRATTLMGSRF